MWLAALHHTEMAGELAALQVAASFAAESVLGHLPSDTFRVDVLGELATEFQKMEEWWSRLEQPAMRIYDLLLGTPPGRARLADHLDKAAEHLWVELAAQREVDAELEVLQALAARVQDLELGSTDGPSSLAASVSTVVELLEDQIDAVVTNGVR
jgi:hypothetical protein